MAKRQPPSDPKEPETQVRITDFAGMACGMDMHDVDPGETYFQVNCVPFHPGELRARRGFVPCLFEPSPGVILPAGPLERPVAAESSLWVHTDARLARELEVRAYETLVVTAEPPASNWHAVHAQVLIVMTSSAGATK